MSERPDPFLLKGAILEGKYRVDRFVAEGGFGTVYAGHHLRLDVPLAIKVLKTNRLLSSEARAEEIKRFLEEARMTARLTHPNITRALDTGVLYDDEHPDGLPWLALEWLEGQTLEAELDARRGKGGRTPRETFELLGPVVDAIAYAHSHGIVHRDLKPSNVMLVKERGKVAARILDFGIAKLAETSLSPPSGKTSTESTSVAFSPGYAAPEQVSRARTGPWTDVHALGLLLTEMLTDESPYGAEDSIRILSSILSKERPTPERRGYVVGPWEAAIRRAVALNPGDRHKDAGELYQVLASTVNEAEEISRASLRPQGPGNTIVVGPPVIEPPAVTVPDAGPAPSRSTTVPNTSAVFPSEPPRSRGKGPLALGLGAAVVLGAGWYALRSPGSVEEAVVPPAPSSGAAATAREARALPDAGARASAPASPSAALPVPSSTLREAPASAPRTRHVQSGAQPVHVPAPPAPAPKERLAPTSSFE